MISTRTVVTGMRGNTLMGSARFCERKEARELERAGDLVIGRSGKSGRLLRYHGAAHLLTMVPTRPGKDVGTIIPNLACCSASTPRARMPASQHARGPGGAMCGVWTPSASPGVQ